MLRGSNSYKSKNVINIRMKLSDVSNVQMQSETVVVQVQRLPQSNLSMIPSHHHYLEPISMSLLHMEPIATSGEREFRKKDFHFFASMMFFRLNVQQHVRRKTRDSRQLHILFGAIWTGINNPPSLKDETRSSQSSSVNTNVRMNIKMYVYLCTNYKTSNI